MNRIVSLYLRMFIHYKWSEKEVLQWWEIEAERERKVQNAFMCIGWMNLPVERIAFYVSREFGCGWGALLIRSATADDLVSILLLLNFLSFPLPFRRILELLVLMRTRLYNANAIQVHYSSICCNAFHFSGPTINSGVHSARADRVLAKHTNLITK